MSCDLLPTDTDGPHYCGDVRDVLDYPWDLMIAHPPCTHLSVSGAKHFQEKRKDGRQQSAVSFFMMLARAPIPKIAIENPVCIMSSIWRKPDQIVHPFHFGNEARKPTCLWLKNLPLLRPTDVVGEGEIHTTKGGNRIPKWYNLPPSADRSKLRSATFPGIAQAMADQWSPKIIGNSSCASPNPAMKDIQTATMAARQRTGDKTIGTRVKQGKFQIVRVEYAANGKSTVTEVSGWLAGPDLIPALNALK